MILAISFLIHIIITFYIWVVILNSLLTLIQPDPNNQIILALDKLSRPSLNFVRRKMPFVIFSGIDLSPVVVITTLLIVDKIVNNALLSLLYEK